MSARPRRIAVLALAGAATCCSLCSFAQDTFQAEAGVLYYRSKADDSRVTSATLDATYFFQTLPQQAGDYPLEQIPFVERAGGFSASYSRSSADLQSFETLSDPWNYRVFVRLTPPDTPLILGAGYGSSYSGKLRGAFGTSSYDTETDTKSYELALGSYVDKATALILNWGKNKGEGRVTFSSSFPDLTPSYSSTTIGLTGQHLVPLGEGNHLALWALVAWSDFEEPDRPDDKTQDYFLQGTYYPTKVLGVRVGIQITRGDRVFPDSEAYSAGVNVFSTPLISTSLDYNLMKTTTGSGDQDVHSVFLGVRARF